MEKQVEGYILKGTNLEKIFKEDFITKINQISEEHDLDLFSVNIVFMAEKIKDSRKDKETNTPIVLSRRSGLDRKRGNVHIHCSNDKLLENFINIIEED